MKEKEKKLRELKRARKKHPEGFTITKLLFKFFQGGLNEVPAFRRGFVTTLDLGHDEKKERSERRRERRRFFDFSSLLPSSLPLPLPSLSVCDHVSTLCSSAIVIVVCSCCVVLCVRV